MTSLRGLHKSILGSISQVQERTGKILQEQEKDLLRAFRARLYSVQEELETEKNKTDDGASAWIDKSKQLETEVEWTKEMADRLDRLNQSLTRENQRLKTQFSMQENDREFLVRQLVTVKKDNVRLRKELADAVKEAERTREEASIQLEELEFAPRNGRQQQPPRKQPPHALGSKMPSVVKRAPSTPALPGTTTFGPSPPEVDNRYKEIIKRLKRVLEVERRNLRQVRNAYTTDLQTHTELSIFVKQCIEDVKGQLHTHTHDATPSSSATPSTANTISVLGTTFAASDRQKVIDLLLSQERVLGLLYAKAFPLPGSSAAAHAADAADGMTKDDIRDIFNEAHQLDGGYNLHHPSSRHHQDENEFEGDDDGRPRHQDSVDPRR
ncbi:hypothetical protein DYB25_001028 [Aphanomyces astaci]|uniref:Cilia- and flagella-associated protein 157 n=1 Tax=Aphanomyces astaci TaxID=112090 RepID=A0A397B287_APHAT|nr:hypothetical protein DYB36_002321 [Aphanomyces astaci]RHY11831.1 hypothetical protein DYB25_001028 [Aphanomyces astaci]RHY55480.1 hypothetical protein DYB34_002687 [Aphanomyces astaci]RHY62710.1 hypothetical protein DYB38_002627 [Aphanomyces astaci]